MIIKTKAGVVILVSDKKDCRTQKKKKKKLIKETF